jgi:hypothetical protein
LYFLGIADGVADFLPVIGMYDDLIEHSRCFDTANGAERDGSPTFKGKAAGDDFNPIFVNDQLVSK